MKVHVFHLLAGAALYAIFESALPYYASAQTEQTRLRVVADQSPAAEAEHPTAEGIDFSAQLESLPSVVLAPQSSGGSTGFVRGGDPNLSIVTYDGVPMNDPTDERGGSYDFGEILSTDLSAFTVDTGGVLARSGAVGPASSIRLSSRSRDKASQARGLAKLSSDNQQVTAVEVSQRASDVLFTAASAFASSGRMDSQFSAERQSARLQLETDIAGRGEGMISVLAYKGRRKGFPDDSGGVENAVVRELRRDSYQKVVGSAQLESFDLGPLQQSLQLGFLLSTKDSSSPGVAPGLRDPFGIPATTSDTEFRRLYLHSLTDFALGERSRGWLVGELSSENGEEQGSLRFGDDSIPTEYSESRLIPKGVIGNRFRVFDFLSLVGELGAQRRFGGGAESLYLASIELSDILPSLDFALTRSKASKQPSFYALFNPIVGNRELEQEESETSEFRTRYEYEEGFAIEIAVFRVDYKNLVDFDPGPPPMLLSRSAVRSDGVELKADVALPGEARLTLALSYTDTRDRNIDKRLLLRPHKTGLLRVEKRFGETTEGFLSGVFLGSRRDSSVATGEQLLGSHLLLALGVKQRISENIGIEAGVNNLLHKKLYYSLGSPGNGLSSYLTLNMSL